ncbi:MAG TPA: glycosyltransferase [Bacteroidota bacterium]|nr:glycosyltransferase [Bacteroidota bacterium]
MKIIIVGTAYPLRGGIAHFNALLAAHLSVRHSVETITFRRQYPGFLFPGTSQEEQGGVSDAAPAPQLIDSINPLSWGSVGRLIRRRKPDLVIFKYWLPFFGPCFGTIASTAKQNPGTKVLFICDNIIPHERRPGDVLFTRYAFKRADYFIVQSDAVEKDLLRFFPRAVYRKVPHPVYENFGPAVPPDAARKELGIGAGRTVLFFGYIRAYKGLGVLLDALRIANSRPGEPRITALVVGEFYEDERKYRSRVAELGLENDVKFVAEYVPNSEVGRYFGAADAVVLPYLSATQSGIAQIAYHFDKPLIVTGVGGLAEVVRDGETGFVVPPDSPDALAEALGKFFTPGVPERCALAVQREKPKYSWDNFVGAIEQLREGR